MEAVLADWRNAPVTERVRAALALLEAMTSRPGEPMHELVDAARAAGLGDRAIEDAANVGFHFNFIDRLADAFDFQIPDADQLPKVARLLDRMKRVPVRAAPTPSWIEIEEILRPVEVDAGRRRLLEGPAEVPVEQRRAAEVFCARLRGARRAPAQPVPAEWTPYLDKLTHHAFKIVDEDVTALRSAGWTDRGMFEMTLCGAFGASLAGLETLLASLHGR